MAANDFGKKNPFYVPEGMYQPIDLKFTPLDLKYTNSTDIQCYSKEEENQINFDLEKIEFFVKELYKDPSEEFLWYPEDWPKVTNNGKTCNMLVGLCACAELHEITRWWKIFDIEKDMAESILLKKSGVMDKYIVNGKIVTGQDLINSAILNEVSNAIKTSMGGYAVTGSILR